MQCLNLGILAHVDAGKTSLTERLLHAAGVIDEPGSVDAGNTQTDSLALERRRGITIRSAVVSFTVGGVAVNLIDTPGHPDFIAEVERVLDVLDGAVMVVSAVEGVQAQTRVLMRTLRRLGVPTLVFVNKLDRRGARPHAVIEEVRTRLGLATVRPGGPERLERLAEHDDALLAAFVAGTPVPDERLETALAAQSRRGLVTPVLLGSARTGAGVDALLAAIPALLPVTDGREAGPADGTVFKIERDPGGEKLAYVRMRAGALRVREQVPVAGTGITRVTGIEVFADGAAAPLPRVHAGQIARVRGLAGARIGDAVGAGAPVGGARHHFAPPTLETVVSAEDADDRRALRVALDQLAEQDPLIGVRHDERSGELALTLYGEVQKEVIAATLLEEHGVAARFEESTTICIERPAGSGRGGRVHRHRPEPVPRHGRAAGRAGARGQRDRVRARGRARLDAALLLHRGRGDGRRDVRGRGAARLAGRGRAGDDDPLGLLGEAELRARGLRQEHVEHGARLPRPHAGGAPTGARCRRDGRLRAGPPVPARGARGRARCCSSPRSARSAASRTRPSSPATTAWSLASSRRRACTPCACVCPPSRAARACWRRRSATTARCAARRRRSGDRALRRRSGAGGDARRARRACRSGPSRRGPGR